jgi:mono/diheme cytochrome c family protein
MPIVRRAFNQAKSPLRSLATVRLLPPALVTLLISAGLLWLAGCNQKKAPPSKLDEARYLYSGTCARCHGLDGKSGFVSLGGKPPQNLTDPAFQRARSDADLVEVITHGKGAMPAFGKLYRPEEIQGLVEVIRGFDPTRKPAPASSGSQP